MHPHARGDYGAQQQRGCEREAGGEDALPAMDPGLLQVEFDACDPNENHHCPPGDAVQRLDYRLCKDQRVVSREKSSQDAGAQQNSSDDLHDNEWGVVVGVAHAPDQIRDGEDDPDGDQEDFCRT
jgi:hypothetical protein